MTISTDLQDRFRGCLLAGAAGDALGAPVEFMRRSEILQRFGPHGIQGYARAYGRLGAITDDTQMTLFTAEGLLRGHVRSLLRGKSDMPALVSHAYLRWLLTQGGKPRVDLVDTERGLLAGVKALWSARAPGNTCLSALKDMTHLGQAAQNESKGCGAVMRMAPVGLYFAGTGQALRHTFQLGRELGELTHGHPSGYLSAGVLAAMVQRLAEGAPLAQACDEAAEFLLPNPGHDETLQALRAARQLAASNVAATEAIASLGEGWVAEEALAIGVFCALRATDLRDGVIMAVNHDGDSDSTGSIAGNLLGAVHGKAGIPEEWLAQLELADLVEQLADDLQACHQWPDADLEVLAAALKKYPG
ncbi:MAG: hypothetical protein JWP36_2680 [Paucimonas sp.]|nr:hypothetical protein [Paucimonas sp.]